MENPYQPPKSSALANPEYPKYDSLLQAAMAGTWIAVRWVTKIIAPVLVLVFFGLQVVFVYRGATDGRWPEYNSAQFWYSMAVFALVLIASFLVACFWAGLFAAILYSIRYLTNQRDTVAGTNNARSKST